MVYTDKQLREIVANPERLRGYFWRVATGARQRAIAKRKKAQRGFIEEDSTFRAEALDRFADYIIDNMDDLVEGTMRKP